MVFTKTIYRLNLFLLFFLTILNLFTVFTPEIGFDALWYHLTLPKLWLWKHQWYFPGGLLYYSAMPRLAELIFTPLMQISGYVGPKLVQYLSGIGTAFLIYKTAKKIGLNSLWSLLSVNIFYITWLVSWQSGSAYIDLMRTFLEMSALYLILNNKKYLAAVLLGLAIGTKWFSLSSLIIYSLVFGTSMLPIGLLISLPWFVIAFLYTGNPIYPIFDPLLKHTTPHLIDGLGKTFIAPFMLTFPYDDFLSPVIGLTLILSSLSIIFAKQEFVKKIAIISGVGTMISLFLNPPSSRYFLPYLPLISLSAIYLISILKYNLQKLLIVIFTLSFAFVVLLRIYAFQKNIPYIFGKMTTNQYLTSLNNRLPDTFIDTDEFVKNNIPANSKILINNLHNLYYFPYNFDHTSWVSNTSGYDYLVTKNEDTSNIKGVLLNTNSVGIQVFKFAND